MAKARHTCCPNPICGSGDVVNKDSPLFDTWFKCNACGYTIMYAAKNTAEVKAPKPSPEPTTDALVAALRGRLKAMGDEDRYYILEEITRGYCLHCGSDDGGECTCMRDE